MFFSGWAQQRSYSYFVLIYMQERCFVVVFTKRIVIFGLSRAKLKINDSVGFYNTNQALLCLFLSEKGFPTLRETAWA